MNTSGIQTLAAAIVVAAAVTGYFVGLQSPMNPVTNTVSQRRAAPAHFEEQSEQVVPATSYLEISKLDLTGMIGIADLSHMRPRLDPDQEIKIGPEEKTIALAAREKNRAFNGAPPTIPHPVTELPANSCMVCHGEGAKTESLRISQISHPYLTNCLQCHVQQHPEWIAPEKFRENLFVGLAAPTAGPRAFELAPPQIPHSVWMRDNCSSCHGLTGLQGIRTTHPWRKNCMQCHAPSAELNQMKLLSSAPSFLPGPEIEDASATDNAEGNNND
ncbi:MAG: diheme cytochrome c precursor [Planctomyces sp.]|nr:diheme cytochrome c precursor [Planctomyces sp.]